MLEQENNILKNQNKKR